MSIDASLVKELREKTSSGIMDCKAALTACNGNIEEAIDWLRKKGFANAAKKSNNVTFEGLTGVKIFNDKVGVIIEVNSQTDFVEKNAKFQSLIEQILEVSDKANDLNSLNESLLTNGKSVGEFIEENIYIIGEKLSLSKFTKFEVSEGIIISYTHNQVTANMGKISVLLVLKANVNEANISEIKNLGKQLAMHIVAANPKALNITDVSPELLEKERNIFVEQAKTSGKPENVIEKMVQGRINKFYEESVLTEQIFVMDNKSKISTMLSEFSDKIGTPISIINFVKFEVGEDSVAEEKNFADEVASILSK